MYTVMEALPNGFGVRASCARRSAGAGLATTDPGRPYLIRDNAGPDRSRGSVYGVTFGGEGVTGAVDPALVRWVCPVHNLPEGRARPR